MRNRRQVVVIGLGRFGSSLAVTLTELGHEVLGLDIDQKTVDEASEHMAQALRVDATSEEALKEVGVRNFDIGVVAIGDVKSSILITLLLKRLGVGSVVSKATDDVHGEILEKVGADRVVYPERETGARVAHWLATPSLVDYLQVGEGYGVAKLVAPPDLEGKSLGELKLKGNVGPTVLLLRRGTQLIVNPGRDEAVHRGDLVVIAGRDDQIEELPAGWWPGSNRRQ